MRGGAGDGCTALQDAIMKRLGAFAALGRGVAVQHGTGRAFPNAPVAFGQQGGGLYLQVGTQGCDRLSRLPGALQRRGKKAPDGPIPQGQRHVPGLRPTQVCQGRIGRTCNPVDGVVFRLAVTQQMEARMIEKAHHTSLSPRAIGQPVRTRRSSATEAAQNAANITCGAADATIALACDKVGCTFQRLKTAWP